MGTGLNEPPALVKEHTYKVLNRSTHVLDPVNETGVQFEAYYSLDPNTSFNLKDQTMVLDPKTAIQTFLNCEMDTLVLGNFIVKKTIT